MKDKNIIVGVTGGIAAYKACEIVSGLKKLGANIDVIMTKSATEFVAPLTFETLSKNAVTTDMFAKKDRSEVELFSLAKKADLFLIAPASTNIIGKIASGIADDMLSTTVMATGAKVVFCPAMNSNMYENPIVQRNIGSLAALGYEFISAETGLLACGDVGVGRLAEPAHIIEYVQAFFNKKGDYAGKKVLITAGATRESIDGVRYITNYSSGKMGIELAKAAHARGASVTLVAANVSVSIPNGFKTVCVNTTKEMYDSVLAALPQSDIVIKAAAPADYRPDIVAGNKIKSEHLTLELVKNPDIAAAVGKIKGDKKLIIFCAETEDLEKNALKKLKSKNADMIVANDVTKEGAGFNCDTNIVTIYDKNGQKTECEKQLKSALSNVILDKILGL